MSSRDRGLDNVHICLYVRRVVADTSFSVHFTAVMRSVVSTLSGTNQNRLPDIVLSQLLFDELSVALAIALPTYVGVRL